MVAGATFNNVTAARFHEGVFVPDSGARPLAGLLEVASFIRSKTGEATAYLKTFLRRASSSHDAAAIGTEIRGRVEKLFSTAPDLAHKDFLTQGGRYVDYTAARTLSELFDLIREVGPIHNAKGETMEPSAVIRSLLDHVGNPQQSWRDITLRHRLRESAYCLISQYRESPEFHHNRGALELINIRDLAALRSAVSTQEWMLTNGRVVSGHIAAQMIEDGEIHQLPLLLKQQIVEINLAHSRTNPVGHERSEAPVRGTPNKLFSSAPTLSYDDFLTADGRYIDFTAARTLPELCALLHEAGPLTNGLGRAIDPHTMINLIYDRIYNPTRPWTDITLRHRLREAVYALVDEHYSSTEFQCNAGLVDLLHINTIKDLKAAIRRSSFWMTPTGGYMCGSDLVAKLESNDHEHLPTPIRLKMEQLQASRSRRLRGKEYEKRSLRSSRSLPPNNFGLAHA